MTVVFVLGKKKNHILLLTITSMLLGASLGAQLVKKPPAMWET